MAKRKLTRRQSWRIKKIQAERAARAERRETRLEAQLEGGDLGPEQEGLIISHFGRSVDVEALEAPEEGQVHRCHLRANLGPLVTGDRVVWRAAREGGVVVAARPRHSELLRPNNQGELKPVGGQYRLYRHCLCRRTPCSRQPDRPLSGGRSGLRHRAGAVAEQGGSVGYSGG